MGTKYFFFTIITAFIMNLCTEAFADTAHYTVDLDRVAQRMATEVSYNDDRVNDEDTREVKVIYKNARNSRFPGTFKSGVSIDRFGGVSTTGGVQFAF